MGLSCRDELVTKCTIARFLKKRRPASSEGVAGLVAGSVCRGWGEVLPGELKNGGAFETLSLTRCCPRAHYLYGCVSIRTNSCREPSAEWKGPHPTPVPSNLLTYCLALSPSRSLSMLYGVHKGLSSLFLSDTACRKQPDFNRVPHERAEAGEAVAPESCMYIETTPA